MSSKDILFSVSLPLSSAHLA